MERIVITKYAIGILYMQVCCEKDCTDQEILDYVNDKNPSGTTAGWREVIREGKGKPVICEEDSSRLHILISC